MDTGQLTAKEGAAETPLHAAAWTGDLEEVKRLVAHGADVNALDSAGEAPLHGAAAWGHSEVVAFLIATGASVNQPNVHLSPLHWAAGWGNLETVKVLLAAGANPRATNEFGETPEQVARHHNKHETAAYLQAHAR